VGADESSAAGDEPATRLVAEVDTGVFVGGHLVRVRGECRKGGAGTSANACGTSVDERGAGL
jgi:hypothetical protein